MFLPSDVTWEYYSAGETTREAELTFKVRDNCIGLTWTDTEMIIVDELTVDEYQGIEAAGQLSIEKQVLSILTEFTLTHPSYEQFNTLITDKGCGEITYY